MKPHLHARISAKKWGGDPEDYQKLHDFIDYSKISVPDVRHRAMLHSSWGIYVVEMVFGTLLINSEGKEISTRDLAEEHIIQDLGFIPTMERWLNTMPIEGWMSGSVKRTKVTID